MVVVAEYSTTKAPSAPIQQEMNVQSVMVVEEPNSDCGLSQTAPPEPNAHRN
jgi:hypothetical protein